MKKENRAQGSGHREKSVKRRAWGIGHGEESVEMNLEPGTWNLELSSQLTRRNELDK